MFSFCKNPGTNSKNSINTNYLHNGFKNPPLEARPRALWDWVDGNFSLDEITHEMEEAVAKGMGGFDIWDVRKVVDEENIVPAGPAFMSNEYMEGITHAINEAQRLNLDLGLIIASGWNAGGVWTKPEHQTMGLFQSEKDVKGPGIISVKMDFPALPEKGGKPGRERKSIIPRRENGLPEFYSEVCVIAIPVSNDSSIIEKSMILDISDKMDKDGNINWEAPEGSWKITRYVCTNTGQPMISCTPNSVGPMIDHFNPEATEKHINFFISKIEQKLGKPIGKSGLKYLYTDSYEVIGFLWTEKLLEEFEKRMGYSLVPFIPVFDGFTVENSDITRRFLYDYRKVWSDLIIENHYKKATEICESHGISFVAEAAGPGMPVHNCPFESLKSSGSLSFPRGEFWHLPIKNSFWTETYGADRKSHYLDDLQVLKGVSSASHIYNQKYVEAEAFTGTHIWVEGPGDLKPTADRAFCEGLNRINFHTWPHTPKEAGEPGWAYAFGTLMHETRIWWPKAKPWIDYLARCSFMLQQGNFVGDVLYFYGDSTPNFVPAKHINPSLGFGYDYDVTNSDILVNKLEVENGKLILPHGQQYEVLVLPEENYMVYEVLEKIAFLIKSGATVIGPKPSRSHGLKDWQEHDKRIVKLANEIWGNYDGGGITENTYGKGEIVWGKTLKEVFNDKEVEPDFDFIGSVENDKLDFIHRSAENAEIYFIRNSTGQKVYGNAIFRVDGSQPEMWDPVSGVMNKVAVFSSESGKTTMPLSLDSHGSIFIVFTPPYNIPHFEQIFKDNEQIFPKYDLESQSVVQCRKTNGTQLVFNQPGEYVLHPVKGEPVIVKVEMPELIELTGAWQVHFPKEKKGVDTVTFNNLYSWPHSDVFDIKFFSGIASYEKEFIIPPGINTDELSVIINLGVVRELAHVYVNGKDAGISWVKPNKVLISDLVKPGKNNLKIEVANTWHNRLCGDAKLPETNRITRSNIIRLPNAWSYPMKEIPLETKTVSYPLQESGLIGPVTINFARKISIP